MSVQGKAVAFVTSAEGIEQAELTGPWQAVQEAGGRPVLVATTLTEIGVLSGRTVTSWPTLQTDLRNAGATWVDREVVVDTSGSAPLITSRKPDDVPAFSRELLAAV